MARVKITTSPLLVLLKRLRGFWLEVSLVASGLQSVWVNAVATNNSRLSDWWLLILNKSASVFIYLAVNCDPVVRPQPSHWVPYQRKQDQKLRLKVRRTGAVGRLVGRTEILNASVLGTTHLLLESAVCELNALQKHNHWYRQLEFSLDAQMKQRSKTGQRGR